jgi:hypothetical protein
MKKLAVSMFVSLFLALGPGCGGDAKKDDKQAAAKKKDAKKADAKKADAKKADAKKGDDKAAPPPPPIVTFVSHKVADYGKWKGAFDAHLDDRKGSGAVAEVVYQSVDDPNHVYVVVPGTDVEKAKGFVGSEDLKKAMADAGVQGKPEVYLFKPVVDIAHEPPKGSKPAVNVFVLHKVADFGKWKEAFAAGADQRKEAGVIGLRVGQLLDDPNMVGVHGMGTDLEKVKAMLASEDMKKSMAEAGVEGEPKVYVAGPAVHEKMYGGPAGAPAK